MILKYIKESILKSFYITRALIYRIHVNKYILNNTKIDPKKETVVLIMSVYNNLEYTKNALESYYSSIDENYNHVILIFDDKSSDETEKFFNSNINKYKNMLYIRLENNMGVTWHWNEGIRLAKNEFNTDYIFLMDNDILFTKDSINRLINILKNKEDPIIIGPISNCPGYHKIQDIRNLYPNYIASNKKKDIENISIKIKKNKIKEVDAVNGFFWGGKRIAFEKNTYFKLFTRYYFNPKNRNVHCETEFEKRFKEKGYKIFMATNVFIFHYKDVSCKRFTNEKDPNGLMKKYRKGIKS